MEDVVGKARREFLRSTKQLKRALATTPDDKINWSPAPTARTPAQIVGHCAEAIKNIHQMLDGHPFAVKTPEEADPAFRDSEKHLSSREEVLNLLEQNSAAYVAWLDALTPDRLSSIIELPFGLGTAPVSVGLAFAPGHTLGHVAQIEYIQTIYGDRDWHTKSER